MLARTALIAALSLAGVSQAMAIEVRGEPQQGALLFAQTQQGAQVTVDGQAVRVTPDGVFLIGIGRDDSDPIVLEAWLIDGRREQLTIVPLQREYAIQRIDGLPAGKVSPRSEKVLARIRRDRQAVKQARRRDDARLDFLEPFEWPVVGPVSGVYGSQRILNGKPKWPHFGIDIAVATGTPVKAPASGLVTLADADLFYSGGTVILDHGHGLSSSFLHLSEVNVTAGQHIAQGEVIGAVGATGRVTGPHLDWRMNLGNGKRLDPGLLMGPMPTR